MNIKYSNYIYNNYFINETKIKIYMYKMHLSRVSQYIEKNYKNNNKQTFCKILY